MPGKVILVGAGPGDPGLLTRKGLDAIRSADVVVYDRLVSPAILALMLEDAEQINVGKEAAHHLVPQEGINQILLDKALEGKTVVRLKGGDPFLFGRGGEELELLARHRIPFEEVPGITSAIAAPAYGGIPVTHRDCCSSLHIVTGHQRSGKELDIDFEALVRTGGTLVFLMGVSALPALCQGLLDAGMDPDTPAATVESGTTPAQRRTSAALADLPRRAAEVGVKSPAVIVVGQVCALAEQFDWFDRLPLKGKTVVVTRPRERAGTLSGRLRSLGADVWEYPCISTVPLDPCPALEEAMERLGDYEWLALTSPAGVDALWRWLEGHNLDARALGGLRLAAAGLKRLGLEHRITRYFTVEEMIPAAGQGILALQSRAGEDLSYLSQVVDEEGTLCAMAERAFVRRLDGGCSSPIAAHAQIVGNDILMTGLYVDEAGNTFRRRVTGPKDQGEALAVALADEMKEACPCPEK